MAEGQTLAVDLQAEDEDAGEAEGTTLTYSLTGGVDQPLFAIDAGTGVVTFKTAPDFDSPGDFDGDNIYEFQATVTDSGGLTGSQDITVKVNKETLSEPNDTIPQADPSGIHWTGPSSFSASSVIGNNPDHPQGDDVDLVSLDLRARDTVHISALASDIGSPLAHLLRLFDAAGNELANESAEWVVGRR